jgi:hypothetical protein
LEGVLARRGPKSSPLNLFRRQPWRSSRRLPLNPATDGEELYPELDGRGPIVAASDGGPANVPIL